MLEKLPQNIKQLRMCESNCNLESNLDWQNKAKYKIFKNPKYSGIRVWCTESDFIFEKPQSGLEPRTNTT